MAYPPGLHVLEHPPAAGWDGHDGPPVVLVHGALDRASSFRRTMRRLDDLGVVAYDRRGYGRSVAGPTATLADHVADLFAVIDHLPVAASVTAVGHSFGCDVVIAAALADPTRFASVGAYEPPVPWLGFRSTGVATAGRRPSLSADEAGGGPPAGADRAGGWPPAGADPAEEAERFFRRMVGDGAWDRLPEADRARRRSEGPALVADLAAIRGPAPFDVTALTVPVLFGRGGPASRPHHRAAIAWLAEHVPGATLVDVDAAGHGAHLSHPDAFATFVRSAVALAGGGVRPVGGRVGEPVR
jgi:pimeloyl-ACP methyl ester carboxylesterase